MKSQNLHGILLSGGESRRMGKDKGLITQDAFTWANRAVHLLQEAGLPVSIIIRETQRMAYEEYVDSEIELLTDLELPMGGPLRGLVSFHQYHPTQNVLALPADMPDLTIKTIRELSEFSALKPNADAWVFKVDGFTQPFPGIYSSRLLAIVLEKVKRHDLPRFGLLELLRSADTEYLVYEGVNATFKNYNYPQDLIS